MKEKKKSKVIIIAEAGVNHNGNLAKAFKLVDLAKKSGADFIKFQYFDPNTSVTSNSKKANYQLENYKTKNNTQKEMLKKFALSLKDLIIVAKYCKKKKINFLLSIFDHTLVENLKKFKLDYIKIPSGEITNYPLLKEISKLKKKVILSTGLSSFKEIKDAIKILKKFKLKNKNITILHCTSDYPAKDIDLNLLAIPFLKQKLKLNVGYSDHTPGSTASTISVSLGANMIEKHFTLDKSMKGPDHKASLGPQEIVDFIRKIRKVELMLGKPKKILGKFEKKNLTSIRKSIYAKKKIKKNEIFTENNISVKRPAIGLSPMYWDKIIGKKSKKKFSIEELIKI
jgi:N,N'-diacetyllegionaminate synthase